MEEINAKGKGKAAEDVLFLERLEMLYEQSLSDLRAFADREGKPFDEVRRRMAEIHCQYLFDHPPGGPSSSTVDRKGLIRQALMNISEQLEFLERLAGVQSFFLVVDPSDQADGGFLGGTVLGREFWRGHRGCGSSGAQAFKAQCQRTRPLWHGSHRTTTDPRSHSAHTESVVQTTSKGSARELKAALYSAMRDALRAASGMRNAEMKWTNHSKLDTYGVRVVGWPDHIPMRNPSSLSVAQNQLLFELLSSGQVHFERIDGERTTGSLQPSAEHSPPHRDEDAMFEDSIDYSWAISDYVDHASDPVRRESADYTPGAGVHNHPVDDGIFRDTPQSGSDLNTVEPLLGPNTSKKRRVEER
ncbi:hypothetical protein PYCCODRAFT_1474680 [Trametes coccinea BRFM310]|uniref:Uncharacterized protein n=1 Tax=Trametes coccinea (strain BRFM310) TaxID=1353009 RepID=A0A1Y2IZI6_TRAC3|nr:hypothetical protein PYCCODRAFT_1474680 [Trametes coccinea BRFM310]